MDKIVINNLLPNVFKGMQETPQICESQIWDVPVFVFERGCRLCLKADSGSGKTSLLSFIYGIRDDYQGKIYFDDKDIRTLRIDDWCAYRQKAIALLPQQLGLFPELTVIQNIQLKNALTHHKTVEQIRQLLDKLGVSEKIDQLVGKLSVGQQQRVAIVRALCQPFDFIFLDEPVSHLDETNNRLVAEIIDSEARTMGAAVISTSVGNPLLLSGATTINL